MKQVKIQIPSLVENIRVVESFIDNSKDTFHIEDDIYGNIMVAVTEAVNNAIRHGNKFDKDRNVYLSLYVDKDRVKFEVEDEGEGFDYTDLLDPTAPENLENPGGRGIFLIRHLADEVEFTKDGRNVQLTFMLTPAETDESSATDTVSSENAA
ncbi:MULTISPECIES: ATP-binding protein [Hymenobacter]|uniref:ATP-binding protein n=2 Tax=Hymenobacter TaxID=89966 RepID=A0A8T9QAD1_9BACT|nr:MULTISPECIES: ATP-binding protein [Hymenobacter]PJJ48329.1 serine/threonine-protein kinase RsbW [Hymenobacter chitinivorans DSM 11115]UOQ73361.1 ATP-binding protein [Hymenobacter cellulosilyticus]